MSSPPLIDNFWTSPASNFSSQSAEVYLFEHTKALLFQALAKILNMVCFGLVRTAAELWAISQTIYIPNPWTNVHGVYF